MATDTIRPTAHDRLKESFWAYVSGAMILSVLIHFVALRAARFDGLPDYRYAGASELEQVELAEATEYEIPPPPEAIARPAIPVLSTDLTLHRGDDRGARFQPGRTHRATSPSRPGRSRSLGGAHVHPL
jgi:hypothetical protein